MGLLYGPRIEVPILNVHGFQSGPVRLNIDDVNEIIYRMKEIGMQVTVGGTPFLNPTAAAPRPIPDIANAHAADIQTVEISGHVVPTNPETDHASIRVIISPLNLTVDASVGYQRQADVGKVVAWIRQLAEHAPRGPLPPNRTAVLLDHLIRGTLIGLWVWLAITWRNLPGLLLTGALTLVVAWQPIFRNAVQTWMLNNKNRSWLTQKSRADLNTERADRRRDLQVRVSSAVLFTPLGALIAAVLIAWFI